MIVAVARFALEVPDWERLRDEPRFNPAFFQSRLPPSSAWAVGNVARDETTPTIVAWASAPDMDAIGSIGEVLQAFGVRPFAVQVLDLELLGPPPEAAEPSYLYWSQFVFPAPEDRCPVCGVPELPHMPWCPVR